MKTKPSVVVQDGRERAQVFAEGGISFSEHIMEIGWIVAEAPSFEICELAAAVRSFRFPNLPRLTGAEIFES